MQSIGVKTGAVEYRQVHDEIQTTGNVEADETRLAEVQVRFAGWIQKVYVDSTFKQVQKGQPPVDDLQSGTSQDGKRIPAGKAESGATGAKHRSRRRIRSGHAFVFCDGATEAMGNSRARDC